MIQGILGVVPCHKAEIGRFYLSPDYGVGSWLFQCVRTSEQCDGQQVNKALVFKIGDKLIPSIDDIPDFKPLVALYDVHVRVDPTSISSSMNRLPGKLLMNGDAPIFCAINGYRGWTSVDINTGSLADSYSDSETVAFDRWSLVLDDDVGDELTIASFDYASDSKV